MRQTIGLRNEMFNEEIQKELSDFRGFRTVMMRSKLEEYNERQMDNSQISNTRITRP